MPILPAWLRELSPSIPFLPASVTSTGTASSASASPDPSLQCDCHPTLEVVSPVLCDACRNFISRCHWIQTFKQLSSRSPKSFERRLKQGSYLADGDAGETLYWDYKFGVRQLKRDCPFCQLLGATLEESATGVEVVDLSGKISMDFTVQFQHYQDANAARLNVTSVQSNGQKPLSHSLRLVHELKGTSEMWPANRIVPVAIETMMGSCTGSQANFDTSKKWLETCLRDHWRCRRGKQAGLRHPARLIDVGSEDHDPFLYETEEGKSIPQYMALSHCWGGKSPLTLCRDSLDSHKKGIAFDQLSKTFEEAILVVRRLGYRYIWIDSLCIIQDSVTDWEEESQFMGEIYRNAVCTIAATASEDGNGGLFRIRNPLRNHPCELWSDGKHGIYIHMEKEVPLERYRHEVSGGPLNSRAWVLQERYLSARVLHFASSAVYWDCQEVHCSDYAQIIDDDLPLSLGFGHGFARPFQIEETDILSHFSERWEFAVEIYSRMKLTRESDRLQALMGVTRYFETRTKLQCYYGLWEKFMLPHLLWRVGDSSLRPFARNDNGIPSWAWASIEAPINFFPPHVDNLALTFWYPENDGGWPDWGVGDFNDPNLVEDIVSRFITTRMDNGVDSRNGYSSEKIFCAEYRGRKTPDPDEPQIIIKGKLNTSPSGEVMTAGDSFAAEQEKEIIDTLRISQGESDTDHRLLICQWPDTSEALPDDVYYLQIMAQGAHRPKVDRFLNRVEDDYLLAPYALHTSGLILGTTEWPDTFTRIGYFRSIETFARPPPPHPKGVNLGEEALRESWFGDICEARTINL